MKKRISIIFGTRPEAIKLAPVILALKKSEKFYCNVCVTAQHREMLDQILKTFKIVPDVDLNLMKKNQALSSFAAKAMKELDNYYKLYKPDMVLIQGDTTTVFVAAMTAYYNRIAIGHVEAGLRTGNLYSPWPEEGNRIFTSRIAALNFAPTERSKANLLKENIPRESIIVTGNTVIDALFFVLHQIQSKPPQIPLLPSFLQPGAMKRNGTPRMILITGHRRENFGEGLSNICRAITKLAYAFPDVHFVYPVHLNPNVKKTVHGMFSGNIKANIHLIEPLEYISFVALMSCASLILTDSGGIQEEASSLGIPLLIMRDTTERPEVVEAGVARIVGTNERFIVEEVTSFLMADGFSKGMPNKRNLYGEGNAAFKILKALSLYYKKI